MRNTTHGLLARGALVLAGLIAAGPAAAKDILDVSNVQKIIGVKGDYLRGERVLKFTIPRTDIKVTMQGIPLEPAMGLTSWIGFQELSGRVMVMADIVLLEDEVNPVIDTYLSSGLAITGLHAQIPHDEPRVYVMHVDGGGEAADLARMIRAGLDRIQDIRSSQPPIMGVPVGEPLGTDGIKESRIEKILGQKGKTRNGVFKSVIGRSGVHLACGCAVSKEMFVKTWFALSGSDKDALAIGEIATFDGELQPTLKALRRGGLNILNLHTHLEGESPRVTFVSYSGRGAAEELARAFRAVLDQLKKPKG